MKKIISIIMCFSFLLTLTSFAEEVEWVEREVNITNGGFEEPLNENGTIKGWTLLGSAGDKIDENGSLPDSNVGKHAYGLTTEKVTEGTNAFRIYDGGNPAYVQMVSDPIPVKAGASYTFSFDALGKVVTTNPVYVSMKFTATEAPTTANGLVIKTYEGITAASGFNGTTYVSKSRTIFPGEGNTEQIPSTAKFARIYIYTAATGRGHALVDNIKVKENFPRSITAGYEQEFKNTEVAIENGDFEQAANADGTIPGWEKVVTGTPLANAPEIGHNYDGDPNGSYYVGLTKGYPTATPNNSVLDVYDKGAGASVFIASEPMEVEVTNYKLTFDAIRFYQTAGTSHVVKVALKFTETPEITTTGGLYAPEVVLGGSYVDYKNAAITVDKSKVPADAKYVRIYVFAIESGGGHAYVDNFKLIKDSKIRIRNPYFTDENDIDYAALPESGVLNVCVKVDNGTLKEVPVIVLAGLIDEKGNMIDIKSNDDFLNVTTKQEITLTFDINEEYASIQVMTFKFDNGRIVPYYSKTVERT